MVPKVDMRPFINLIDRDTDLETISKSSVLPMTITKNGLENEPILEVIICSSIAGGAKYQNDMPTHLTLTRIIKLENGKTKELDCRYIQSSKK